MSDLISTHYDDKYFDWQASMGEFGGWANQSKFAEYISSDNRVLDFGCGGGFLDGVKQYVRSNDNHLVRSCCLTKECYPMVCCR